MESKIEKAKQVFRKMLVDVRSVRREIVTRRKDVAF